MTFPGIRETGNEKKEKGKSHVRQDCHSLKNQITQASSSSLSVIHLLKASLSSCSETNCPKLATNKVEQGIWFCWWWFDPPPPLPPELDPTGLDMAGDAATKWAGGIWACIACIVAALIAAAVAAWLIAAAAWLTPGWWATVNWWGPESPCVAAWWAKAAAAWLGWTDPNWRADVTGTSVYDRVVWWGQEPSLTPEERRAPRSTVLGDEKGGEEKQCQDKMFDILNRSQLL